MGDTDSRIERSCHILEDNEVINENNSAQSYRILLIDKPVEGKYRPVNASYSGITALHRKSIDGSGWSEALRCRDCVLSDQ